MQRTAYRSYLDLGHGWHTFTTKTGSSHGHRAAALDKVKDERANEGSEQEPEECRACLEFMASFARVVRTVS
jgi:hypothetical protein